MDVYTWMCLSMFARVYSTSRVIDCMWDNLRYSAVTRTHLGCVFVNKGGQEFVSLHCLFARLSLYE